MSWASFHWNKEPYCKWGEHDWQEQKTESEWAAFRCTKCKARKNIPKIKDIKCEQHVFDFEHKITVEEDPDLYSNGLDIYLCTICNKPFPKEIGLQLEREYYRAIIEKKKENKRKIEALKEQLQDVCCPYCERPIITK